MIRSENMKKRILSAIMAAMMVMFMVPTNVFASVVRVEDAGTLWDEETDRFRICSDNYWADIVTEQPTETEYVVDASAKTVHPRGAGMVWQRGQQRKKLCRIYHYN